MTGSSCMDASLRWTGKVITGDVKTAEAKCVVIMGKNLLEAAMLFKMV